MTLPPFLLLLPRTTTAAAAAVVFNSPWLLLGWWKRFMSIDGKSLLHGFRLGYRWTNEISIQKHHLTTSVLIPHPAGATHLSGANSQNCFWFCKLAFWACPRVTEVNPHLCLSLSLSSLVNENQLSKRLSQSCPTTQGEGALRAQMLSHVLGGGGVPFADLTHPRNESLELVKGHAPPEWLEVQSLQKTTRVALWRAGKSSSSNLPKRVSGAWGRGVVRSREPKSDADSVNLLQACEKRFVWGGGILAPLMDG